jgi:hypothetical protein
MLDSGNGLREAPPYLDGWDYNTVLELRRELRVDIDAMRSGAGLPTDATLDIVTTAFSTSTWLRQLCFREALQDGKQDVVIAFTLAGGELGGNLRLHTAVLLSTELAGASWSAHLVGSILWDDRAEIRLQGDAPLFPISVIDFERAGFAIGAGWHLDIAADLEAPLYASLRLYLNRTDAVVVSAFARADAPSPEDIPVLRAIFADVARVMIEHALNQEELREKRDWDPDSLGFALDHLLSRYFPFADRDAVMLHRIEHPTDFSTELFGQLHVFGD